MTITGSDTISIAVPVVVGTVLACLSWLDTPIAMHQAESVLVPLYTLLVALYLTLAGWQKQLEPFLPKYLIRQSKKLPRKAGPTPSRPAPTQIRPAATKKAAAKPAEKSSSQAATTTETPVAGTTAEAPVNMTGVYKLVSNTNFEKFLEVQGVPWALRRAANAARPIHRLTHRGSELTIKVTGIIESQTMYHINGPPVETDVRGRIFQDQVTYLNEEGKKGVVVSKKAVTENYNVTVKRELLPDGNIFMTSTATFLDGKDPVSCTQQFQRIPSA